MGKIKTKPKPKFMKNNKSYLHPKNNTAFLIASIVVLFISAGITSFIFILGADYYTAKYKETVTATLVDIKEFEKQKWDYYDKDAKDNDLKFHATYTYTESYNALKWEYTVGGKKHIWKNTEVFTTKKIGDTMEMKMYSNDGKVYHNCQIGIISYTIMGISAIISLAMLFFTIRIITAKIQIELYNKRKLAISLLQEENRQKKLKNKSE